MDIIYKLQLYIIIFKFDILPIYKQKIENLIIIYKDNYIIFEGNHKKLEQIKNKYTNLTGQNINEKISDNKFKIIKHLKIGFIE